VSVGPTVATGDPLTPVVPRAPRRIRGAGALLRPLLAIRRVLGSLGVILSVLTVTFLVTRVFAPDPSSLFLGAAGNGFGSPEEAAAARVKVRADLGLDHSLLDQYWRFLSHLAQGDLGISFQTGRTVTGDLLDRLPATAELALYSLVVGLLVGIVGGVVAAVRHERLFDRVSRFVAIGFMAMPQFWLGLMLLWVGYTQLHLFPGPVGRLPLGAAPPDNITGFFVIDGLITGNLSAAWNAAGQLVLPVLTLGLGLGAPVFKIVRTSMLEALASDYVRTARALGFGSRRIYLVYALKNGLLPVVTILAGVIGFTLAGSILVEGIFGWPGVGNYSLRAIQTSDFPAIQGFVVYSAVLYVLLYEGLNAAYGRLDPRVRAS
jgi:ABC-type dipeptide/oligopeptide/nickel transport system permease component